MTIWDYATFLLRGRLLIFLAQENPYTRKVLPEQLVACDLCLGFWVYLIQSLLEFQSTATGSSRFIQHIHTAALSTSLTHLLRLGIRVRL